jgi:hypothetical protein
MKIFILTLFASLTFNVCLFAQVQDPDTIRNPIKQGDPAPQVIPRNAEYRRSLILVRKDELPMEIKKTLQDAQYKGWEKATFYRNETSTTYLVEIQDPNKTRLYRFSKDGKLLNE